MATAVKVTLEEFFAGSPTIQALDPVLRVWYWMKLKNAPQEKQEQVRDLLEKEKAETERLYEENLKDTKKLYEGFLNEFVAKARKITREHLKGKEEKAEKEEKKREEKILKELGKF